MKRYLSLFLLLFLIPVSVFAFDIEYGPEIEVGNDKFYDENLYILGGEVGYENTLDNDLTILSGKSDIKGAIFGDLLNISAESYFQGEAFGDTRFLAGENKISGITNKDLIIVAGKTEIERDAVINGQTLILAGEVSIQGDILDDLKIVAGKVYIDSEILGDLEITTQELVFGPNSDISGNINYFSPKRAEIMSGAVVNKPVYNQIDSIDASDFFRRTVLSFVSFWSIVQFLSALFAGFILVFMFRMFSQRVSILSTEHLGKSIIVGLASIILIPISILILFASLFGIPVAVIISFITISILILAKAISGIVVGYWIRRKIKKEKRPQIDYNTTALGIVILTFLYFIPVLGAILSTFMTLLIFGAVLIYLHELITIKKRK
jgi:cytoskeletal protein CcmA (bactofilin family)